MCSQKVDWDNVRVMAEKAVGNAYDQLKKGYAAEVEEQRELARAVGQGGDFVKTHFVGQAMGYIANAVAALEVGNGGMYSGLRGMVESNDSLVGKMAMAGFGKLDQFANRGRQLGE